MASITVRGARTHNLQNITVEIPRDALVVITGPSGSGKSSLAFSTLHAEGQRRYIEALGVAARRSVGRLPRPPVDAIDGLTPTVAVAQAPPPATARATVGTITEIDDHLRLLMARMGRALCPNCGAEVRATHPAEIVAEVMALGEGRRLSVHAPVVRGVSGDHRASWLAWRKEGFVRARVDGVDHDLGDDVTLDPARPHDIDLVIDRVVVKDGARGRIQEAVELAMRWDELPPESREWVLLGDDDSPGLLDASARTAAAKARDDADEAVADLRWEETVPCRRCSGQRLRPEALAFSIDGRSIAAIAALSVGSLEEFLRGLTFTGALAPVADALRVEALGRLGYLERAGLDYLSLDRPARTLSHGEFQRARLAAQLGGGLSGVTYILDEPTLGLHPRDGDRLMTAIRDLLARGNAVVLVEHDLDVIAASTTSSTSDRAPGRAAGAWSPKGRRIPSRGIPRA
ncbi:MAG: hypothetical protein IPF99_03285 [Deltaproteobacteria bacterium]|nr:hypothetical protein [Deltaproteobacteria bacterium]